MNNQIAGFLRESMNMEMGMYKECEKQYILLEGNAVQQLHAYWTVTGGSLNWVCCLKKSAGKGIEGGKNIKRPFSFTSRPTIGGIEASSFTSVLVPVPMCPRWPYLFL